MGLEEFMYKVGGRTAVGFALVSSAVAVYQEPHTGISRESLVDIGTLVAQYTGGGFLAGALNAALAYYVHPKGTFFPESSRHDYSSRTG
ncbi:TPA: hypothetical protein HA265_04690 [Candidatus Woesearchaeota archaeon]|nr:hypothetical protein [Candidatus Woesearchaeota archaeon]